MMSELTAVERAFKKQHGAGSKRTTPGVTIVEKFEQDLQKGELRAPRLNELPSKEEVEAANESKVDTLGLAITVSGTGARLSVPVRVKIPMPSDSEEFRYRIDLKYKAIEYMKIRHSASAIWASSNKEVWSEHVEYVLGEHVRGVTMTDTKGKVHKTPHWDTVMHYEQAVRDKAFEFMNSGDKNDENPIPLDIAAAMKRARKDLEVRRVHFIEKFQLQEVNRSSSSGSASTPAGMGDQGSHPNIRKKIDAAVAKALAKANGKANGKGKDKNKDKSKAVLKNDKKIKGALHQEFEKKKICNSYNRWSGCKFTDCKFAHVCKVCLGPHPMTEHE